MSEPYISCPFCGEGDFDKIGLKLHFVNGYCEVYEALPDYWMPAAFRPKAADTATKEKP